MGTIIKRGKSYQVQISAYKHGIQNRLTKTFKTKAEAKHWEREMEIMKGNGTRMTHWTTPFAEFYSDWVYLVKKNDVRESTFQNYLYSIKVIQKLFSNIQLRHLNDVIVQRKLDEYSETRSRRTTNDLLTKIKTALKYAHARGYIQHNFTSILKARGAESTNPNRVLSINDYKKLRDYLRENLHDETNIYFYLVLETGLRRSEALGVRPEDLYQYGIKVRQSISPTSDDTRLKTISSYREVAISEDMYYLIKSIPVKENGYLFDPGSFSQASELKKLIKQINLTGTTTVQGLRRTHASLAYANSLNDLHISDRLGHKSLETTHEYYLESIPEHNAKEDTSLLEYLATL